MKLFLFRDFQNKLHFGFYEVVTSYYNLNSDTLYLGEIRRKKQHYTLYYAFDKIIAVLRLE